MQYGLVLFRPRCCIPLDAKSAATGKDVKKVFQHSMVNEDFSTDFVSCSMASSSSDLGAGIPLDAKSAAIGKDVKKVSQHSMDNEVVSKDIVGCSMASSS